MDDISLFPNDKQLDPTGARAEFEREIDIPDYGDFPVSSRNCYWCGCPKSAFVDGKCPGCGIDADD